ncbi:DgyrCDS1967 [Dimorphilus gyrociliatus]|uniref:DgyrCDS1967 n=1 Tax=Dimorphilus gyrociliatus TaxID=2664684 RepID=A0A7I8VBP2_9ANNE|nr:DgyrCDS1967 [Dimorphilus gyrociliatus]
MKKVERIQAMDENYLESDVDGKNSCLDSIEKSIENFAMKKDNMALEFDRLQFKMKRNYLRIYRLREFADVCQELAERNLFKDFIESITYFVAHVVDYVKQEPKFSSFNRSVHGLKMFLTTNDYLNKEEDISYYMFRLNIMQRFGLDESSILFVYFLCELITWAKVFQRTQSELDDKEKTTVIRWLKVSKDRLNSIEYEKFHNFIAIAENYLRREWNVKKETYSEIRMEDSWNRHKEEELEYCITKLHSMAGAAN